MGKRENNIKSRTVEKSRSSKNKGNNPRFLESGGRGRPGSSSNSKDKGRSGLSSNSSESGYPGNRKSRPQSSGINPSSHGSGKYSQREYFDRDKKYENRSSDKYKSTDRFHNADRSFRPHHETVVGFHAIEEMLKEGNIDGTLFVSGSGKRHEKITILARGQNIKISNVSEEALRSKSPDIDPRGVILEVSGKRENGKETSLKAFLEKNEKAAKETSLVLILDSITDPHNLGAILRSADQFNADLVILPARRSARDSATVRKISSGASEYVPQAVENLSRAVDMLKKSGYWIYAADMGGEDSWKLNLKGKTALVLGSEGDGVSRIITEKSDSIIKIPSSGHVDSFNVSVAAGILMYEAVRQQSV